MLTFESCEIRFVCGLLGAGASCCDHCPDQRSWSAGLPWTPVCLRKDSTGWALGFQLLRGDPQFPVFRHDFDRSEVPFSSS